jgi:hypothetical protein
MVLIHMLDISILEGDCQESGLSASLYIYGQILKHSPLLIFTDPSFKSKQTVE